MKMNMQGWSRTVRRRELFNINLSSAADGDGWSYSELIRKNINKVNMLEEYYMIEGNYPLLPAIKYNFRVEIDDTMGGAYASSLTIDINDAKTILKTFFSQMSLQEIAEILADKTPEKTERDPRAGADIGGAGN